MSKIVSYISEIKLELSKVTWPKREEVMRLTLVIVIISAVSGIYLGLVDIALTKLLEFLVSR